MEIKKKGILRVAIAERVSVRKSIVNAINKGLTVQTYANVRNVKMLKAINLVLLSICLKSKRLLKLKNLSPEK